MATIVVERRYGEPVTLEEVEVRDTPAPGPATRLVSAIDRMGRHSISIFHANGMEALQAGLDARALDADIWTATTNRDDGVAAFVKSVRRAGAGSHALVAKNFPEPVDIGVPANNFDPSDWCLNMHNVRYLHSHMMPDRRRLVCLYVAADVETIARAYRLIPVDLGGVFRARLAVG